jgi:hypothetical protein
VTRAVGVIGAALGLVLLAAPIGSARAQAADDFAPPAECSDPPPAAQQNGISVAVTSPTGTDARTSPTVQVEAAFTNESRRPLVNQANGQITEMKAFVLACEASQVVPTPPAPVDPPGEPRTATFSWAAEFVTNGRFAVVFEAKGTSSSPDGVQSARAVVPVLMAVPPKKPINVVAADPTNGIVEVSWEYPEPEPDLVGFQIRRAKQGTGDYVTIKNGIVDAKARAVSDAPPSGAWRYQVVAFRQGVAEGSVSRDDTVEVPEAAPVANTTSGTSGSGSSTNGSGSSGDATASSIPGSSPGSPNTPRASVDLSEFAAALNARRTTPTARLEPPDPGFQETLPFDTSDELADEDGAEVGADDPNVGLGQRLASDPGERRRSLGFVAFGFLLFVLSMTGLFVKGEVKRADLLDLDAVDADDAEADALLDESVASEAAVGAVATGARTTRRRRRADGDDGTPMPTRRSSGTSVEPAPARAEVDATAVATVAATGRRRRAQSIAEPVPASVDGLGAPPDEVAPVVVASSRRARRQAALPERAPEAQRAPEPVPAPPATPTSRRRRSTPANDPVTAPAAANGSTMAIPETRRRWGQPRAANRPGGTDPAVPETYHDFDDLADDHRANGRAPAPARTRPRPHGAGADRDVHDSLRRRTHRSEVPPLDAPGLDVPDPTTTPAPAPRPRPRKVPPKAPLPTRTKATSGRR